MTSAGKEARGKRSACVFGETGWRMSEVRCGRKFQSGDLLDVSACLSRCGADGQRLRFMRRGCGTVFVA